MRFAKLEIKAIVAMFLTGYDYDAVDKSGVKMSKLPVPNRSNVYAVPVYLRPCHQLIWCPSDLTGLVDQADKQSVSTGNVQCTVHAYADTNLLYPDIKYNKKE